MVSIGSLPYREPAVISQRREDGSVLLRSPYPPAQPPRSIAHLFEERADAFPDRAFLQRRGPGGQWAGPSYREMRRLARSIAGWLLETCRPDSGGVMILSGNSIEHAAMMLGGYFSGIKTTALSQAFSTASADFGKLTHCFRVVRPDMIFVQSGRLFAPAILALRSIDPQIQVIAASQGDPTHIPFGEVTRGAPRAVVDAAMARLVPGTVAKYLFTSGSTGLPKAVPQTHGMMSAMLVSRQGLMIDPDERMPPATVDWMPWSHLSAGNIGFNQTVWAGGTLYIDDGRPSPAGFSETLRNLLDVQPISFASAPIAFELLATALEADASAASRFFERLQWMAYGGAALSQDIADRLQRLSVVACGRRTPIVTTYGSTEVQGITAVSWATDRVGLLGLPLPGVMLKLAPVGAKLEVRAKGPTVMSGYLGNAEANSGAFDEEGFYRLGDAARLVDPGDPTKGLSFDGRISEDFKLSSGTWVSVGILRAASVAAASPLVLDVVLTGSNRRFVGALVWLAPETAGRSRTRERLCERLSAFNAAQGGSSRRIARAIILDEPPSVGGGEITEKGYVNQRAVLERRAHLVDRLYAPQPDSDVLVIE